MSIKEKLKAAYAKRFKKTDIRKVVEKREYMKEQIRQAGLKGKKRAIEEAKPRQSKLGIKLRSKRGNLPFGVVSYKPPRGQPQRQISVDEAFNPGRYKERRRKNEIKRGLF